MKTSDFLNSLCNALNRDPNSLTPQDTPETVQEWDSVGHLTMLATIDSTLGVTLEGEDLQAFTSIGQLLDALKSRKALED